MGGGAGGGKEPSRSPWLYATSPHRARMLVTLPGPVTSRDAGQRNGSPYVRTPQAEGQIGVADGCPCTFVTRLTAGLPRWRSGHGGDCRSGASPGALLVVRLLSPRTGRRHSRRPG